MIGCQRNSPVMVITQKNISFLWCYNADVSLQYMFTGYSMTNTSVNYTYNCVNIGLDNGILAVQHHITDLSNNDILSIGSIATNNGKIESEIKICIECIEIFCLQNVRQFVSETVNYNNFEQVLVYALMHIVIICKNIYRWLEIVQKSRNESM